MSLGDFIKEKRLAKNMSQRELAIKTNLSKSEISRIEAGLRKTSSAAVFISLAKALDVTLSEILTEAGIGEIDEQGEQFVLNPCFNNKGFMLISELSQPTTSQTDNIPYITVEDLTDEEIEDVKKYILFLKSKRT